MVQLKHKKLIAAVIMILVLAMVIGAFFIFKPKKPSIPSQSQVDQAQNSGNYSTAIRLINERIKGTSNKQQKAQLYVQLGANYANSNDDKSAANAYLQSAATNGMTASTAQLLASTYAETGNARNIQEAIYYYNLAIKLWPKNDPVYQSDIANMQEDVNYLKTLK